jgi:hypothetical protein
MHVVQCAGSLATLVVSMTTLKGFPIKHRSLLLAGMLATGLATAAMADTPSSAAASAASTDEAAISQLISNYPRFVMNRNQKGFESLLLDKDIPFSSVSAHNPITGSAGLRHYEQFRQAIFGGTYKYRQTFSNVKIDRTGPLAQVSLTFTVERLDGKGETYTGWKVLQLVKTNGAWKIASELYTFDQS